MSRPLVAASVALASLVTAVAPAHAAPVPHITDPSGDVWGSVCPVPGVFLTCRSAAQPYSQPSIDVVSIDFSSPTQAIVADVGVLDLDAPVVGEGTEGYDGTRYVVAFSTDTARSLWVNFIAQYDRAGVATRGELMVFIPMSGRQSATRPIDVTADVGRDRVRFLAPLAVLNEAIAIVCPECAPVTRGSELLSPFGSSVVFDEGTFGQSVIADDLASGTRTPYVVGK